jgi:hypothetical protein
MEASEGLYRKRQPEQAVDEAIARPRRPPPAHIKADIKTRGGRRAAPWVREIAGYSLRICLIRAIASSTACAGETSSVTTRCGRRCPRRSPPMSGPTAIRCPHIHVDQVRSGEDLDGCAHAVGVGRVARRAARPACASAGTSGHRQSRANGRASLHQQGSGEVAGVLPVLKATARCVTPR